MKPFVVALLFAVTTAHAEFRPISIKGAKAVYQQSSELFNMVMGECLDEHREWRPTAHVNPNCAFPVFTQMIAGAWIQAHKPEALAKAAKRHQPFASPEDIWELPYANDWIGCMAYQFDSPDQFAKFKFETFLDEPVLGGWIQKNKALESDPDGAVFIEQLKNLSTYANLCEEIIRKQPPQGSMEVSNEQANQ